MKRTFLSLSLLVAVASLVLGNSDADARWRCCRARGAYGYQNASYGNAYQQPVAYQQAATTGTGCNVVTDPNAAPANPPAPPQEVAPAPTNQAPAAPAPGT